ncbi:hypothetical protein ACFQ9X_57025 [Catenulispora yoronensis]
MSGSTPGGLPAGPLAVLAGNSTVAAVSATSIVGGGVGLAVAAGVGLAAVGVALVRPGRKPAARNAANRSGAATRSSGASGAARPGGVRRSAASTSSGRRASQVRAARRQRAAATATRAEGRMRDTSNRRRVADARRAARSARVAAKRAGRTPHRTPSGRGGVGSRPSSAARSRAARNARRRSSSGLLRRHPVSIQRSRAARDARRAGQLRDRQAGIRNTPTAVRPGAGCGGPQPATGSAAPSARSPQGWWGRCSGCSEASPAAVCTGA